MSVQVVTNLFKRLEQLEERAKSNGDGSIQDSCSTVQGEAEKLAECLYNKMNDFGRAQELVDELAGAVWKSVRQLAVIRKERDELKTYVGQLKLVDAGVDPRPIELKQEGGGGGGGVKGGGGGMKQSASYEDFRKQRMMQSASSVAGQTPGFRIRKARSDPDVGLQNMKKDLESLKVDNQKLRQNEKKLLKTNLGLGRRCKLLTEERDRAEDRLKIEQTQRDSIERLRQRNKELEDQVQRLRQRQLIKEREAMTE